MEPDALRPMISGGIVQVRYDGGSSPGKWRTVENARIDGRYLACVSNGSPRRLLLDKIQEAAPPPEEEEPMECQDMPPCPPDYADLF